MITEKQIRAGRAMLDWSAKELAEKSGLSLATIQRMEADRGIENALGKNLMAVQAALETGGIEFLPENGLRLRAKVS